jgi:hypothetical protein
MPSGPVYFVALMPVVLVWIAVVAVRVHDGTGPAQHRAPAMWLAQFVAALLFFWPTLALESMRSGVQSSMCQDLVQSSAVDRALVFAVSGDSYHSWQSVPMASPRLDDPVLFTRGGPPAWNQKVARVFGQDRQVLLARCVREWRPELLHYDPASGRLRPFRAPR